jgi:subtilase-type serine protease
MKSMITPRRRLLAGTAIAALSIAAASTPAMAVVPNENTNSEAIVDDENVFQGVGAIVTNQVGTGGIGICTGTLINPRTVLFAAHCVNDLPETAYNGTNFRAAVSFNFNALPGLQAWFANSRSNPNLGVFNINRIFYNPLSLQDPFGLGFIEADIALATLDTPAARIPTWALLFSTLPAPATIDPVRGTGYHVNIVGFGGTGNATQGAVGGIDFRRRAAENLLGGFFSLDDQDNVLFGEGPETFPQNLYQLDFDSRNRNFVRDINVHRDDALPNEGTTAGGDSGGPLILDAANNRLSTEDLVIGVLSGGSRFFGANQPFSSIGTTSFYQPLSLYWQYIAATNPYRYVGAVAGNGNWEDASRWVTLLDPAYRVINAQGQVVNGLPTTPELGVNGTGGDFGSICVEFETVNDTCTDQRTGITISTSAPATAGNAGVTNNRAFATFDVATGELIAAQPVEAGALEASGLEASEVAPISANAVLTSEVAPINGRGQLSSDITAISGTANLTSEVAPISGQADLNVELQAQGTGDVTLPAPTIANGLPGATGFIANNVNPVVSANPAVNVLPRYFDVTLSQTGTTTLSSTVTIDRLTVRNTAGLTVNTGGNLTSLIDINQFGGRVNVNGRITSVSDYTLFAGMLEGTGTVTAPFLTSVTGVFSPGTMGTTGTLNIAGNLVLSSGSTFLVDVGANGMSDRLAVTGIANVGGVVNVGTGMTQQVNGLGQRFTIVTGTGGVTGSFTARNISGILSQRFINTANSVQMEIIAASYGTVIDRNDPTQVAYAELFDQNRSNGALSALYGLDFATTDAIRSTFVGLAPVNEQAVRSLSSQSVSLIQNFNDARLREADKSKGGGKIAVTGQPLELAQLSLSPVGRPIGADVQGLQGSEETEMTEANLPENVGIFLSGGYVSGDADSLPGFAQSTDISGYFISGGIEFYPGENTMVGLSGYYNSLEADTPLGQRVDSETYAASLYLRHAFTDGPVIDGQFTMGSMGFDTQRSVQFLGATQTLTSTSDDLLVSGALGVSYDLTSKIGTISPGIEARYASVDLATVRESGGNVGLVIDRENYTSTQARFGFDYEKQGKMVSVNANAQLVWEFEDGPQLLGANFAQGIGPNANFVLDVADHTWGEVGLSLTAGNGPFQFSVGADTTIGRDTAEVQVVRGTATYRF